MSHACAQCGEMLNQTGRLDFERKSYAVFQCPHCLMMWDVGGDKVAVAFTFALSEDGRVVSAANPARSLDGKLSSAG